MPKVSIITPTWQRHTELLRAINSVIGQTFADWEHIIVSDGPDNDLPEYLSSLYARTLWNYKYVELGRNWKTFSMGGSPGATPRVVGTYLARGEYIAYLDDDNEWLPKHLQLLVNALECTKADWAYSSMQVYDGNTPVHVVGDGIPKYGTIDTSILIHRAELLRSTNWKTDFYEDDWQLVQEWLKQGCTFAWVNEITVNYFRRKRE